jgi:hypothetical protein
VWHHPRITGYGFIMKRIFTTLLLAVAINGCATAMNDYEQKLQWVEGADAIADAKAALAKGDFRFMAMAQRSTVIPGVDTNKMRQYELYCGVKFIEGATDAIRSEEQLRLMKKAFEYAGRYNKIIAERCQP